MKILFLSSRFPYPIEKGDKLRAYHQIRILAKRHEVILCALSEGPVRPEDLRELESLCAEVHVFRFSKWELLGNLLRGQFRGMPVHVGYFFKPGIGEQIRKVVERVRPEHVFCQLIRMAEYARSLDVPKTLDYMDNFSAGMERRAEQSPFWMRPFLRREASLLASYERMLFPEFDRHTIISAQDRDLLPFEGREKVAVVPNGVDTEFFSPRESTEKSYDLVFVGNMGYYPNVRGAEYLVNEILPEIRRSHPDFRVLIAGARPSREVRQLESENVTVSGWMDDIRDAYAAGKVFAAPLFTGSGLQNKILEAMAMGVPCVSTTLVNNAVGAKDGESVLLADSAEAFAQQILRLVEDAEFAGRIRENGLAFVRSRYSWESAVDLLEIAMGI